MFIKIDNLEVSYEVRSLAKSKSRLGNLWPKYVTHTALKDLSLELNQSGVTAIVGSNGAGKSTLIKVICGLIKPSAGSVDVMGYRPDKRRSAFLRQLGVVLGQKGSLWPELSLRENLEMTGVLYKQSMPSFREQTQEIMQAFDLIKLQDRPVKSYSLGETMKAELTQVFSYRPKLVLLDEPTIGLDLKSQGEVRLAIENLTREHKSKAIITSHNLKDIVRLADNIYHLKNRCIEKLTRPGDRKDEFGLEQHLEEILM